MTSVEYKHGRDWLATSLQLFIPVVTQTGDLPHCADLVCTRNTTSQIAGTPVHSTDIDFDTDYSLYTPCMKNF